MKYVSNAVVSTVILTNLVGQTFTFFLYSLLTLPSSVVILFCGIVLIPIRYFVLFDF